MLLDDAERLRLERMCSYEEEAYGRGCRLVAGIDEAGRGPLAGPVLAAVCILPRGLLIPGLDDSKKVRPKERERLFERLTGDPSVLYAIGYSEPEEIDRINIYQATLCAMWRAVDHLPVSPDCLLVDGMSLVRPPLFCKKIIKGDQLSQSIAAASILAKVTRDRLMRAYHLQWPLYGFDRHKGYGTAWHLEALARHGPCPIHRRSFSGAQS